MAFHTENFPLPSFHCEVFIEDRNGVTLECLGASHNHKVYKNYCISCHTQGWMFWAPYFTFVFSDRHMKSAYCLKQLVNMPAYDHGKTKFPHKICSFLYPFIISEKSVKFFQIFWKIFKYFLTVKNEMKKFI